MKRSRWGRTRSRSGLGFGSTKVSNILFLFLKILIFPSDLTEHEKRLAALEDQVKKLDKVAEETARTSQRMDAMEGSVNRFAGALESFLGRIQIDDRLRLVPDHMRLSPGPLPTTRSASPATPLDFPMDEDTDRGVETGLVQDPPSDQEEDMRMVGPIGSRLAPEPEPASLPAVVPGPDPASLPSHVAAPTVAVVPATPQGSQEGAVPITAPAAPQEPLPVIRSRSRTPAAGLLGVEGRTTRARSRSKTPI